MEDKGTTLPAGSWSRYQGILTVHKIEVGKGRTFPARADTCIRVFDNPQNRGR
jgi:hypothetical protein